ncbi:MAG: DUF481 domain-containing protein [Acidobacteriaceae bacterium]|nr:DUF481 domain-containing protein [Acidobacteriaceae bacterium]
MIDGEKLIGHLESSDDTSLTFKSNLAGEVKVEWTNVKTLDSNNSFAIIEKGMKLRWKEDESKIPQGKLSANATEISVVPNPGAPEESVPVQNTNKLVDQAAFDKAVARKPAWYQDWKGSATVGLAIMSATQTSQTYTSAIKLTRAVPVENWMQPFSRTILSFNSAYGELAQPATPTVKTSIFHAIGERDRYISQSLYLIGDGRFDHDFSQGLDLQQTYGGGLGWTVVKGGYEQFDLKSELAYVNQQFLNPLQNQRLFGAVFSETYDRTLEHKIVLAEQISVNPTFNNTRAYSANGSLTLTVPVLKRISISLSTQDGFLNNPSPGFRKNSLQVTTGLTYTAP